MKQFKVIFQPSGRRGEIEEGKTILEASRELGAGIESLCGGQRACGKCKIKLEEGKISPFSEEEERFISESEKRDGFRLACAAEIRGDVLIFIPEESRAEEQVVRKAATERTIELNPAIRLFPVKLRPPSFHDPLGDFERLKNALHENYQLSSLHIDYPALLKLPRTLRKGNWEVTVVTWMEREVIDVKPGKIEDSYGLAIDVGTTTVAGYLCNLQTGKLISTHSMMNPQVAFGEDVMSRITFVMTHPEDGLEKMHQLIIDGLNEMVDQIAQSTRLHPEDILEVTVVGNTAMHHLLLKINPEYIGVAPFPPALHQSINVKARDLGIKVHPSAYVHVLPIEAGFVGADNVGVLIAEEPYNQDKKVLLIDIGTNGELVMGNRHLLISSSCATGPALEGAHVKFGMRAAPGAIERIRIHPETLDVDFKVIGQKQWNSELKVTTAKGICGSGIIDGMAELFRAGIIDKSGRFNKNIPSPRFRLSNERPEFVIAWKDQTSIGKEITITQQDVRSVQLAKGALYTGAKLMMKRLGIETLDKVVLAGAFGSFIDPEEAMVLGMFPDCDLDNVYAVGNAAGDGARIALLNRNKRTEADEIAQKVEYVELTIEADFQNQFMEAMQIPHMSDSFPHLKGIVPDRILKQ
ncbi:MAG TPA: ASKHA domain-containing protein [Thermodesulfobacteriota bacterium]|nr:ASKHA domain-containing protein [Thermodesulfobacteriota bacterium]